MFWVDEITISTKKITLIYYQQQIVFLIDPIKSLFNFINFLSYVFWCFGSQAKKKKKKRFEKVCLKLKE